MILMCVFLIFAGLLMLFKTSMFWNITELWTSKDGTEPSGLYIWNTRFGGIMCILVGLACLLAYILM
jgi:hypothetical protein